MVDDIGRPRPKNDERQNKNEISAPDPIKSPEAPHLYKTGEGFTAAQAAMKSNQKRWKWPHLYFKHASKREKIAGIAVIAVLVLGGGTGVYALHQSLNKKKPAPIVEKVEAEPEAPTTEASKLTGV